MGCIKVGKWIDSRKTADGIWEGGQEGCVLEAATGTALQLHGNRWRQAVSFSKRTPPKDEAVGKGGCEESVKGH